MSAPHAQKPFLRKPQSRSGQEHVIFSKQFLGRPWKGASLLCRGSTTLTPILMFGFWGAQAAGRVWPHAQQLSQRVQAGRRTDARAGTAPPRGYLGTAYQRAPRTAAGDRCLRTLNLVCCVKPAFVGGNPLLALLTPGVTVSLWDWIRVGACKSSTRVAILVGGVGTRRPLSTGYAFALLCWAGCSAHSSSRAQVLWCWH